MQKELHTIWAAKLDQLNLASDNLNSWREVSYLGQSHKLSESGAIPERSNHVLERNDIS